MDAATAGVIATGTIGLAGIIATFFAPTWTDQKSENRRRKREFRTAQRLVSEELRNLESACNALASTAEANENVQLRDLEYLLSSAEWEEHKVTLSSYLPHDVWTDVASAYRLLGGSRQIWSERGGELTETDAKGARADSSLCHLAAFELDAAEPIFD